MIPVCLMAARRSIIAPRGGALSGLEPHDIAAPVIRACLADAGIGVEDVDELIVSNALGAGGNPARMAALAAGLPERVAGLSVDRQCVGGLDALLIGHAMIASGQARVVIAGGVESYSNRPHRARTIGGDQIPYDRPPFAPNPEQDPDLADAADELAQEMGISRDLQDAFTAQSHAKALAAQDRLQREIVGGAPDPFARQMSDRLLARAPVIAGTVTHANTAPAADGAAFVVLSAGTDGVRMRGGVTLGADPARPAYAPVPAALAAMDRAGVTTSDLTHAEVMEAYAAQAIACQTGIGLNPDIMNQHGGALARGHPIGASGAVLAVRLFHDLMRDGGMGLACIAGAGGLGTGLILSRND